MFKQSVIIRFQSVCDPKDQMVRRITGFVPAKHILNLIEIADLQANPREAKVGNVTDDIIDSIKNTPELFPFKTKGVLIAASEVRELERNRYELNFSDSTLEGILDGGHNMLALGVYFVEQAFGDDTARKIKTWEDLKNFWDANKDEIHEIKDSFDFLVPVEVLCPRNAKDKDDFLDSIHDICVARNNNRQLKEETKANQRGFFDFIKNECLDSFIEENVEWKTNTGGRIKVSDIVALAWIPLLKLELPATIQRVQLYSSKGKCIDTYNRLFEDTNIASSASGTYTLNDKNIKSALKLLSDLPSLYDLIYQKFPEAYNKNDGSFGRIESVRFYDSKKVGDKNPKYLKKAPKTLFYEKEVSYSYPDGFIWPLVYGLSALIKKDSEGQILWSTDPYKFIEENLVEILKQYKTVIDVAKWNPQNVGKQDGFYQIALSAYESILIKKQLKENAA
ncbi:MAG: hypothetical protein ACK52W_08340 [Alphaproteobacteria bacterium]